jgi:PAS domain S-box-containing protein
MPPKKIKPGKKVSDATELRHQAEQKLLARRKKNAAASANETDNQRLVHELQVHQIEVEMQNEELIQARAESEAALRQYADLYDFAPAGYFTLARDGKIKTTNLVGADLLGLERSELIGRRFGRFVSVESRPTFSAFLAKVFSTGGSNEVCEVSLQKDESAPMWAHIEAATDNRQEICRAVVVDITERKQAEEALALERNLLRSLIDNLPDFIYVKDTEGRNILNNLACARRTGLSSPQEMLGTTDFDHFPQELAARYLADDQKVLRSGQPLLQHEEPTVDAAGNPQWISTTKVPLRDGQGKIYGLVGAGRDITESKLREKELRSNGELLHMTSEMAKIGGWEFDALTLEGTWTDEVARIHDLDSATPTNANLGLSFYLPDSRSKIEQAIKDAIESAQPYDLELQMVSAKGNQKWVRTMGVPVVEDDKVIKVRGIFQDITERKQAEEALRESEDKFKYLFDHSVIGKSLTQLSGAMEVNDSLAKMLGYAREELSNFNWRDITHPDDIELNERALVPLMAGEQDSARFTKRYIHKNGSIVWADVNTALRRGKDGEPLYYITAVIDITERKQAEEKLIVSETRYRRLFESAKDGILILNAETGVIVDVNPFLITLLGYSREAFLGKNIWELGFFKDIAANKENFLELQQKEYVRYEDLPLKTAHGQVIEVEFVSNVYQADHNKVIQCNIRDISERKKAETQIQRQLQHLNALHTIDIAISSSFDIHVILGIVLQQVLSQLGVDAAAILLLNPQMQTIEYAASRGFRSNATQHTQLKLSEGYAGRAVYERQTIHIPDLLKAGGKLAKALQLAKEDFVDYHGTPLIVKGEVKGVLETYHRSPINPGPEWLDFLETLAGQAAIAIDNAKLFDNLQRANAELEQRVAQRTAELNQTNLELEYAGRAKDEFLANMSHELRTPLNSILGLSETLLEQRHEPLSDRQQQSLQIIESSGRHLLELINDVLDLSKIEAGKFDYYPQVVDVDLLCRSSLAFVKEPAMRKSIALNYKEETAVSKIYADPRRLKQTLVNLLINAVKFTPDHGEIILQVDADAGQDLVQFSVIDTGIGIAPDDLKKLFQPFVQVDSSLTREYEGTGLGLALVHKLTDLHGGSVGVESEVGKGSRFTVNIPWGKNIVAQQQVIEAGGELVIKQTAGALSKPARQPVEHGTILLAEDNMSNILTVGDYLESRGYRVVVAHDGVEALEKAVEIHPDIVLMDIQMPVMDGLEAMRRLRADTRFASTPIIALTALTMPGDRERCLEAGANEYMSKPIGLKNLTKTISKMLGHKD